MDIVFFIAATVISTVIFKMLFVALNKSMLNLFAPIQKFANRQDRKKIYKNVSFVLLIFGNAYIKDYFNLSYIMFGITLGLFLSLHDMIFNIDGKF